MLLFNQTRAAEFGWITASSVYVNTTKKFVAEPGVSIYMTSLSAVWEVMGSIPVGHSGFFLCPTLMSCWLFHLYHFITELKIHHHLFVKCLSCLLIKSTAQRLAHAILPSVEHCIIQTWICAMYNEAKAAALSIKWEHEIVKQFKAYGKAETGSSSNINSCARARRILRKINQITFKNLPGHFAAKPWP